MSKLVKVLILVLTLWLPSYIIFFFVTFINLFINEQHNIGGELPSVINFLLPLHFFTVFIALGLMAFYIYHIVKRKKFTDSQRVLWVILVIFTNAIGMLIYFFLYVWKDEEGSGAKTGEILR